MENKFTQQQHLQQKSVNSSTTTSAAAATGGSVGGVANKYLDHVYCHPNANEHNHHNNNRAYMRANNNHNNNINLGGVAQAGSADNPNDVYILLKENKRLKTMLMLHLDLIQEQSDQLLYKDKKLATLTEKVESMLLAKQQLEAQVQELQYKLQRQLKRSAGPAKELASVSPPPLAKIQSVVPEVAQAAVAAATPAAPKHIIGECNGKLISKIKLHRVAGGEDDGSANTSAETLSDGETEEGSANKSGELKSDEHSVEEGDEEVEEHEVEEVEGEEIEEEEEEEVNGEAPEEEEAVEKVSGEEPKELPPAAKPKIATPVQQICVTPPTPSRGKQMPLMLWHAPDINSDESGSGESLGDPEQQSQASPATPAEPAAPPSSSANESTKVIPPEASKEKRPLRRSRRLAYMTTTQLYLTREWEDSEAKSDCEPLQEDVAMQSGASLEIPKWIEHELTPLYCIEGTEDLSDDTFLKRHAKLEVDEKRRKKWDVQQIREQRRIEKLKRRHCKDELQNAQDQQSLSSFYPQPEDISMIYYTNQLPVQAFGEMIPKLNTTTEFTLPWTREPPPPPPAENSPQQQGASGSVEAPQPAKQVVQTSSYTFLKKRRRRQSSTQATAATTARQRSIASQKMAQLEAVASK